MDKLAQLEKELLADMEENPVEYRETVNNVFEIDSNLRTINIPVSVKNIGVESDDDVKRLEFAMPKKYGEFDLSQFRIRINYMNANGEKDIYLVEDKKVSGDKITFSWLIGRDVVKQKGQVNFIVCLKLSDEKGKILKELNTTLCKLEVLEGLEVVPVIDKKTTDLVEQLLRIVQTETTGAVRKVTEEGTKQVTAVQKAAQEIAADREQIHKNKLDTANNTKKVSLIGENLSHQKDLNWQKVNYYYNKNMTRVDSQTTFSNIEIDVLPGDIFYFSGFYNYGMCPYIVIDSNRQPLKSIQEENSNRFEMEKIEIPYTGSKLILQQSAGIVEEGYRVVFFKATTSDLKDNVVGNKNIRYGSVMLDNLSLPVASFFKNCQYDFEELKISFETNSAYLRFIGENYMLQHISITDEQYGYTYIPVKEGEMYEIKGAHSYQSFCYALTTKDKIALRADGRQDDSVETVNEVITIQSGESFLTLNKAGFKYLRKITAYKPNLGEAQELLEYKKLKYLTPNFEEHRGKYVFFKKGEKIKEEANAEYSCAKISVKKGDKFIISGNHSWRASCWILTDENDICIRNDGMPDDKSTKIESDIIEIADNESFLYLSAYGFKYLKKYEGYTSQHIKLNGKKIVYDGDSICESRGASAGKGDNGGGYPKLIADKTNSLYVNQAVGGATLRTLQGIETISTHSVVDNLDNLPKDGDLYCFEGGINDYWQNADLGTFSKTDYDGVLDKKTVCGALEYIFRYALEHFAGKPIYFIIVHKIQKTAYTTNSKGNTFEEYHDKFVGICEKYSIPYFDAFKESGLNGWNTVQNNMFFQKKVEGKIEGDGCHPNKKGYEAYYVPKLIQKFEGLL